MTTTSQEECFDAQELEELAVTDESQWSEHAKAHQACCRYCREAIAEIRENNQFLEAFSAALSSVSISEDEQHAAPATLPGYELVGEIHRGGQGIVYRAVQLRTKREVAFKVLLRGKLATTRQRLRFEREAEIIAGLRHRAIVTIYDAGYLGDGSFSFAMELIEGKPLDEWTGNRPVLSKKELRERLELFAKICDAAGYAHRNGVVHRDLKPANILIDKDNQPHILDFGIAKALQADTLSLPDAMTGDMEPLIRTIRVHQTLPGEFAGTPAYASPEQVSGDPSSIDARTDIYSLGMILYQLLTGELPYSTEGSLSEIIARIQKTKPEKPSTLVPLLDDDIDSMVLRALEKHRDDRYVSVDVLTRDISLYLAGLPIETRRDETWYVVHKTLKRHWVSIAIASAVLLLLVGFSLTMTVLYKKKNAAELRARQQLRSLNVQHGHLEGLSGNGALAGDLLWQAQLVPGPGSPPSKVMRFGHAVEPLDSYWALWSYYAQHPCVKTVSSTQADSGAMRCLGCSPDGSMLVTSNSKETVLWSMPDLEPMFPFPGGRRLAGAFGLDRQTLYLLDAQGHVESWQLNRGAEPKLTDTWSTGIDDIRSACITPRGTVVLRHGDSQEVWICRQHEQPVPVGVSESSQGYVHVVRTDHAGRLLATVSINRKAWRSPKSIVQLWSLADGHLLHQVTRQGVLNDVAFSKDDEFLYWVVSGKAERWAYGVSKSPTVLFACPCITQKIVMLDSPNILVCADNDRSIRLWDMNSKKLVGTYMGHTTKIYSLLAIPGTQTFLSSGSAGCVHLWNAGQRSWKVLATASRSGFHDVAFNPASENPGLALISWTDNRPKQYNIAIESLDTNPRRVLLGGHDALITSLGYNASGTLRATADFAGIVCVWDVRTGALLHRYDANTPVYSIAFSPADDTLAAAGDDSVIRLYHLTTETLTVLRGHKARVPCLAFSPDGLLLASCSRDGTVCVWNMPEGTLRTRYMPHEGEAVRAVAFSPDGRTIASGSDDYSIGLHDLATNTTTYLIGHPDQIFSLAFGPDGRVLVSGDRSGNLFCWDVKTKTRLITFPKHNDMLMSIAISDDGRYMATASAGYNPEVRLWDLQTYAPSIAGNLDSQIHRVGELLGHRPENASVMKWWAAELRASR